VQRGDNGSSGLASHMLYFEHQPVMKVCNNSIKVGDYKRSKSQTLKFTNVKTHQILTVHWECLWTVGC